MPIITLPDGNNLDFPKKVTGLEVAEKISKSLAKDAMVISVDGELKDLEFLIEKNCSVKIFTSKNDEGLETIRHDTAHILAMAVQELFPGTQVTIGPDCIIGERNRLHEGCVVGSDGFGYIKHEGKHQRLPQIGIVQTAEEVDIGANSTIDRAMP